MAESAPLEASKRRRQLKARRPPAARLLQHSSAPATPLRTPHCDAGKTSDADMREADGNASSDMNMEGAPEFKTPRHATLEDEEVDLPSFLVPERPPHWKLPAPPNLKTNAYLVGVSGIVNDIRAVAFAMEGYGDATTLVGIEELSDEDLQGLKEVCGADAGIDILCPRRSPLSAFELDNTLNSIGIRREMASLLRHFNSRRLAERVFKMTGYLRRVLEAYRHMRSLADSQQGASAVQDTVDTRRKYKEWKRSWKFTSALQEQKARYQDEIDSLESEKAQLKTRLADSEAQVRILKSRLESAAVDPWKFSDFLQEHTEFTGNWERLHDLFKFCINDANPPGSWGTVINVTAMDKRKAAVAPYPEKSTRMPPSSGSGSSSRPEILDLMGPASKSRSGSKTGGKTQDSKKSQGSKKGQGSSKSRDSEAPDTQSKSASSKVHKVQRRPKNHQPGRDSVRRAGEKTVVPKEAAHTMLPGGVVWKVVRPDVRQAILAGLKLPGANSTVDDIENDPDYKPPAQDPEEDTSRSSEEEEPLKFSATQETKAPTRPKKPSTLARKSYAELTVEDLRTAEVPEDDETSWRIHGILVLYPSSTKSASCQTPGFPEVFYFHERSLLTAKALKLVEDIVDAMRKHAQAIWERGHWVPIPTEATADIRMESQRKARRNALRGAFKTLMERSHNTPGFIPSLLHEPGLWKIPDKCCHWIWEDPRATVLEGPMCYDLETQLAALDMREPARVHWNMSRRNTQ
ncbi:hypothetical protein PHYSODRAFT_259380 [Phytophthora sojae]|uniref:Uncharacterized protein n=1 Tax=Phytophthora sojae (strain P6497) TaxID=1094619 RepID=G4ZAT5_PHYSP|nr:hypothetical protein PHYSODRAFT_259380 [Phytophthora sojae]EGZ20564.1 hypothetical protein PHYSODRAFT_259380 [Phytophthora sojae]|eukprot:XP_009523281.1 hypothetical protein PHYSODRAFT_259380 [Phytophthora sojae]